MSERKMLFHIPGECPTITLSPFRGAKDANGKTIPAAYYTCRPAWAGKGAPGVIDLEDLTSVEERDFKAAFPPVMRLVPLKDKKEIADAQAAGFKIVVQGEGPDAVTLAEKVVKDTIDLVIEVLEDNRRALNLKDGPPPPKPVDVPGLDAEEKALVEEHRKKQQSVWKRTPGGVARSVQKVTHGASTARP